MSFQQAMASVCMRLDMKLEMQGWQLTIKTCYIIFIRNAHLTVVTLHIVLS